MLTREGLPAAARLFDDRVADLLLRYAGEGPYERDLFVPDERAVAGLRAAAEAVRAGRAAAGAAGPGSLCEAPGGLLGGAGGGPGGGRGAAGDVHPRVRGGLLRAVTEDPRPPGRSGRSWRRGWRGRLRSSRRWRVGAGRCRTTGSRRCGRRSTRRPGSWASAGRPWRGGRAGRRSWRGPTRRQRRRGGRARRWRRCRAGREVAPEPAGAYTDLLAGRFGIALDELLAWHEDAVAAEAEELARAAAAIAPGVPAHLLLDERSGPYAGPEAMFAAARECLALARSRARELIALPAGEECRIRPLPRLLESSYPWGAAHGFPPLCGILTGTWYLNAANWRAVTRGWVRIFQPIVTMYPHRQPAHGDGLGVTTA